MPIAKSAPSPAKAGKVASAPHAVAPKGAMLLKSEQVAIPGAAFAGFAIAVAPNVLDILSTRQLTIKRLVETFGRTIERNRKTGVAGGFTVRIDAAGNPEFAPLPDLAIEHSAPGEDQLDGALRAARERGRLRAAEVLSRDEMLTAEAFADRLGVSRVTVNARRQKHELLGLDGAKRGYRFPAWQVDEDGKPIHALPRLFQRLGDSPWGVYRFLTQRHSALGGATARDALALGKVEQVLQAAESVARGDFA